MEINEAHEGRLDEFLEQQEERSERVDRTILDLSKRRASQFDKWKSGIDADASAGFKEAEKRIKVMERLGRLKLHQQNAEFTQLKELFAAHLRLQAPADLWGRRKTNHSASSQAALNRLFIFGGITVLVAILVPIFCGNYIANSFFEIVCSPQNARETSELTCERLFSAKGPLTVTGLILTWITRLQYRIHLSERHLALDASEKAAFAESYLAMKRGEAVGEENKAIVLASLFRPTQDGIIRDDGAGVDLSVVALLAKQLGKSRP